MRVNSGKSKEPKAWSEVQRLEGEVAIITGGGRGIGRAIAYALHQEGARLALAARTQSQIETVAQDISSKGGEALAVRTDVAREEEAERLVATALASFGKLDILINCAGVGMFAPIIDTPLADWQAQIDINLTGVFLCSRAALRAMRNQRKGHIINISSGAGRSGFPHAAAYCASKFGLMGLTEVLFLEAKPYNIRVSVICPGRVDTTFAGTARTEEERQRVMSPQDVAGVVVDALTTPDRCLISEVHLRSFRWTG